MDGNVANLFHAVKGPKIRMENGLPFPKLNDLIKRDGADVQSYSSQVANHLTIPQVEANPFRLALCVLNVSLSLTLFSWLQACEG